MIFENEFSKWLKTPLGMEVLNRQRIFYDREVSNVFGSFAFQFGLRDFDLLIKNKIPYKRLLGESQVFDICCNYGNLPIKNEVLDLILIPHVLEFTRNPKFVLGEATRVLKPEGHLMLSMMNPWSLWGARKLIKRNNIPWNGSFVGLSKLKNWLHFLNYEIVGGDIGLYLPPIKSTSLRRRFSFLEKAGSRWWPFMGGIYFLHGIKKIADVRLVKTHWGGDIEASPDRPILVKDVTTFRESEHVS